MNRGRELAWPPFFTLMIVSKTQSALSYTDLFSLDLVHYHVRSLGSAENTVLEYYINAALDYCVALSNRNIGATNAFTILLHESEAKYPIFFRGITGLASPPADLSVQYYKDDNTYADVPAENYRLRSDVYPALLEFVDFNPSDINSDSDKETYKISFSGGEALSGMPKQFGQAVLLLTGHFYNQRESEVIGQVTTEVKMGVERLLNSMRKF